MRFSAITIFPEYFECLAHGITGRALTNHLASIHCYNPRDFTDDLHGYIDDRPYGGGPGMVMQAPPLQKAIRKSVADHQATPFRIHLTPTGQPLNQDLIATLCTKEHIILVCGRYEGIDQRVIDSDIDLECSIGDYVLSGGELAALVVIDAVIRQLPGALGDARSHQEDSFFHGLLDHPHYTRPKTVENQTVPDILLNGDHAKITDWRRKHSEKLTKIRRPDLWHAYVNQQSEGKK